MNMRFLVLLLPLICLAAPAASTASPNVALVSARLTKVEDVSAASENSISVDGTYRLKFRVSKSLIGHVNNRDIDFDSNMARPVPNHIYYLLIDKAGEKANIVWFGVTYDGLCIDSETAEKYNIENSLRELQETLPCRRR
jgi:hypothetical protein